LKYAGVSSGIFAPDVATRATPGVSVLCLVRAAHGFIDPFPGDSGLFNDAFGHHPDQIPRLDIPESSVNGTTGGPDSGHDDKVFHAMLLLQRR
jgi:hypothetical protein